MWKDQSGTKELNGSCDCAQAVDSVNCKQAYYLSPVNFCELSLKQVLERPLVPSPIPDPLTLPSLTVMHKYFNSNALHLEIKGLIQGL